MKKFIAFLLLSCLPAVVILVFSLSLAERLVFSTVYFLASLAIINSLDSENRTTQTRRMHTSSGLVIALNVSVFAAPPIIAIIIAGGLLTVGLYEILREDELFGFEFYGKWDGELMGIAPNITMLLSALFSGLMIVANFDEQLVWVPAIALGFLIIASIRQDLFSLWKYNTKALQISAAIAAIVVILIGIISTLIQFNEARIFGVLIWVIGVIVGALVIIAITILYFRFLIKEKRRKKLEKAAEEERKENAKKEKEMLKQSLTERAFELTWEEIFIGFDKIHESFGIQLFLSSPNLEKLPDLVIVSNEKEQFFWEHDLSRMLLIMEKAANKSRSDEDVRKILDACDSIEDVTAAKKSQKTITYNGEGDLYARLNKIRRAIKS